MRVVNPKASPVTQQDKDDLTAALAALVGNDMPTLAEIRAAMPAGKRGRMTDGMIHQTALDSGLKVID